MGILLNKSKNYAINGTMDFWQRGTSFAAVADSTYTADRFVYRKTGTMVHTASRDTDVPTAAQAGFTLPYSMRLNLTTAQTSLAAGDFMHIGQRIEGQVITPLFNKNITVSFWVKATLAGTYAVAFKNSANDRSYVATYTINTANTWKKETITLNLNSSSGTFLSDSGVGLRMVFSVACGSTRRASSLNTWLTGDFESHSSCVNGVNTGATDLRIAGVQLEEGTTASGFERAGGDYASDLRLCQRYYTRLDNPNESLSHIALGKCTSTTGADVIVSIPTSMRVAPTTVVNSAGNFSLKNAGTTDLVCTTISSTVANNNNGIVSQMISITVASGLVAGDATALRKTGVGVIGLDAEL